MPQRLTISIAMCTYNGERFLPEQLDSFLAQTRLPDELVVCDDASTDRTGEILGNFKAEAPFRVRISINEQRLGYRKNFEKAMSLCQGDLMAFSDQDDLWLPEKLQKVEEVFLKYPSAGFVFHDAEVVDEGLHPLGFSLWDYYGFSFHPLKHFASGEFTKYCLDRVILGATITLNAGLRDHLLPFPELWAHDTWVSFAGGLIMEVIALPEKLNKYRQHSEQLFGASLYTLTERYKLARKVGRANFTDQANRWKEGLKRFASDTRLTISPDILKEISERIEHLEIRGSLKGSFLKRLYVVIQEISNKRYFKYNGGWKSVARDLLLK